MYAAAGGASIASRRKQKRLVLQKRGGSSAGGGSASGTGRGSVSVSNDHHGVSGTGKVLGTSGGVASGNFHHHHHHNHNHHHHAPRISSAPFPRPSRISRPPNLLPPPLNGQSQNQNQNQNQTRSGDYPLVVGAGGGNRRNHHQLIVPVSPITFPISPPPLSISLESSNSLTYSLSKTHNHFPFPPPADLRISSTTDLQCSGQSQTQGKAAWQGCSRPSPLPLTPVSPLGSRAGDGPNYKTKQCEAHRRWMKRNRIRDASYCYGSSGEEEEDGQEYGGGRRRGEVSAAVNTVLYAGLGTTALGLVISFVGTGEKGFQSSELRLVGPSLLCAGLLCCLLRVLLCLCLCHCGNCQWRKPASEKSSKPKDQNNISPPGPPLLTASLLPPLRATVSPPPPIAKGRELLLSAAQLSE